MGDLSTVPFHDEGSGNFSQEDGIEVPLIERKGESVLKSLLAPSLVRLKKKN